MSKLLQNRHFFFKNRIFFAKIRFDEEEDLPKADAEFLKDLRAVVANGGDEGLTKAICESVFVGPVDEELCLLQFQSKLYMLNLATITRECVLKKNSN